jgi:predicted amidophosphoribosyltransferase
MTRWHSVSARHQPPIESATRAVRALFDVLLPPRCAICGAEVDRQGLLCADCFRQTGFISEPFCTRCGVPFGSTALGGMEGLCPTCRAEPPVFGRARAALRYDAQGRRLVLPFKHADRTELTVVLAPQMARAGAELLQEADVIVPVPLHRWRLFQRRYNQDREAAMRGGCITARPRDGIAGRKVGSRTRRRGRAGV